MKKRFTRWLKQWFAKYVVLNHEEWGGTLHDYDNGKWVLLQEWQGKNWEEVGNLLQNMWDSGKDAIYICAIKVGPEDGYFVVSDSNRYYGARFFFHGIYDRKDAYADVVEHCRKTADKMGCRKTADKMGFRRPENTEGVKS